MRLDSMQVYLVCFTFKCLISHCRFCHDRLSSAPALHRANVIRLLPDWHSWACQQEDLSEPERFMTWGPTLAALPYARAVIGGQAFTIAKKQRGKSNASVVMTRVIPAGATHFGELQQFYKFRPPWVKPSARAQTLNVADIAWFKNVGQNRRLDNAPEVSKTFWNDPSGNLRWCESIIPTPIALVPHLSKQDRWQVMHIDPDFCSRDY